MLMWACQGSGATTTLAGPSPTLVTSRPTPAPITTAAAPAGHLDTVDLPEGIETVAVAAVNHRVFIAGRPHTDGSPIFEWAEDGLVEAVRGGIAVVDLGFVDSALLVVNGSGRAAVYGNDEAGPGFPSENAVVVLDPVSGTATLVIEVLEPVAGKHAFGRIWVLGYAAGQLMLTSFGFDGREMSSVALDHVGTPTSIEIGQRRIWVSGLEGVVSVDPSNPEAPAAELRGTALSLAITDQTIWVVRGGAEGGLFAARDGEEFELLLPGTWGRVVPAADDRAWVFDDRVAVLVDGSGAQLASVQHGVGPLADATALNGGWVAAGTRSVSRFTASR